MARKRNGNMKNYAKIRINQLLGIGTLANLTAISTVLTSTMENEGRISSIEGTWSRRTGTAGEGPLMVGVAHPDYTTAEIEAAIEIAVLGPGTMIQKEVANRLVRHIGTFSGVDSNEVLNDGRPIKTKLNWGFQDGQVALSVWVYNLFGTALTTGTVVNTLGHLNVFWK